MFFRIFASANRFSVLGSNFITKDGHNAGDTKEFNFATSSANK